jgi:hypothetical protein
MAIVKQQFTITYEREVNVETGEILKTTIIDSSDIKNVQEDNDTEPKLYRYDNTCKLNSKAVTLMGITAGDKLDIKYEIINNTSVPIIGTDKAFNVGGGTKLTKSNSFSFKGNKNKELSLYGNEFEIIPYKNGLFRLKFNDEPSDIIEAQEEQKVTKDESSDIQIPDDYDFSDLIEDSKDVTASMFQL